MSGLRQAFGRAHDRASAKLAPQATEARIPHQLEVLRFGHSQRDLFGGVVVRGPLGHTYPMAQWLGPAIISLVSTCCEGELQTPTGATPHCNPLPVCLMCNKPDERAAVLLDTVPALAIAPTVTQDLIETILGFEHDPLTATLYAAQFIAEADLLLACMQAEVMGPEPVTGKLRAHFAWVLRTDPMAVREARVLAEFERRRAIL